MLARFRRRLTFANIASFVTLGSSMANLSIPSRRGARRDHLPAFVRGGIVALAFVLLVPGAASASFRNLYFDTTAHFSDYPFSPTQSFTESFHKLNVRPVEASLAGHEPLCKAYAQGRFATGNGRPVAVTPGISEDFNDPDHNLHTFDGFSLGATGPGTYTYTISDPDGRFPSGQSVGDTNEPFWIDRGRYLGTVRFSITLKKDGSGSIIEHSPHSYEEKWTCSARPPISLSVLNQKGEAFGTPAFSAANSEIGAELTLAGEGFDPKGGPIELFLDKERIARVHEAESFRVQYRLSKFPNGRCDGTFRAVQGRDHLHVDFSVRPQDRVVAVQGGVRTHKRALHVGDEFCKGGGNEEEDLARIRAGQGVVLQGITDDIPVPQYSINSRPPGAKPIEADLKIEAGSRLVVQMPHGEFQAKGPGGNPPFELSSDPRCTTVPAQSSQRVSIVGCKQAAQSVHLNGGADIEAVDAAGCHLPTGTGLVVDGSIVIREGATLKGHGCGAELGAELRAHDGAISISGGIVEAAAEGVELRVSAKGSIILHG